MHYTAVHMQVNSVITHQHMSEERWYYAAVHWHL